MQAKLQGDARFSASDFFKKAGISGGQLTRIAIIVFSHDLFDRVFSRLSPSGTKFPYDGNFREGINTGLDTTLVEICTGSTLAAAIVEELFSLGVRRILLLGTAGSINEIVRFNDMALCTGALRDEGTSYHYAEPSDYAFPSERLTAEIAAGMPEKRIPFVNGTSWTTDAPYV